MSKKLATFGLALGLAASAQAANVAVSSDITTSTTWTANNVYNLVGQIYVRNGATLTIEAGTKIRSNPADLGSLAVTRGSKIIAVGTASNPIVFTSTNDTGSARTAVNEWGNVTLMGKGLIGAEYVANGSAIRAYDETVDGLNNPVSNNAQPTGINKAVMEGLTPVPNGDPNVIYGGADDNDDSGTLSYISLRYGGKVLGLANELNGLSMGAVGRETDVNHIDIYCNVDDGIETWGGTVNYKYISIWNIGDDSFDIDEGWRGKAQFILIVQGYGANANQGSGVGDNCFETDGAEANTAVPTTTATIYNATVIGQPDGQDIDQLNAGGDHVFCYRDNARIQYRNILVMQPGEKLVQEEDSEGGSTVNWRYGQQGVGPFNTTPAFTNAANGVWGLAYTEAWNTANALTGGHGNNTNYLGSGVGMTTAQLKQLYQSQSQGNAAIGQGYLCEVTDSLFYDLTNANAYTLANSVGVTSGGASNAAKGNVVQTAGTLPITLLQREAPVDLVGGKTMANVTRLDPRRNTANAATVSVSSAPNDGFFTPAQYRGAFSDKVNWCLGWTAASEFGIYKNADGSPQTNPAAPAATATATAVSFTTAFATASGNSYIVESSTDGVNWTYVGTIAGDGANHSVSEFGSLAANMLYRVTIQ